MNESPAQTRKRRPRTASISIGIGTLAWLSPLIAVVVGMLIYSGGGSFAGDGGPNLIWILYLVFGAVAAGLLGLVGSVVCLFGCGATPSPEERRPWILPKVLNYPVGFFGLVGVLAWIAQKLRL